MRQNKKEKQIKPSQSRKKAQSQTGEMEVRVLRIIFVMFACVTFLWSGRLESKVPTINTSPSGSVLMGDDIRIKIRDVPPAAEVTLHVARKTTKSVYYSKGIYKADARGNVDTAHAAGLGGSYKGVDHLGLFWSMVPLKKAREKAGAQLPAFQGLEKQPRGTVRFILEIGGKTVASANLRLLRQLPGVLSQPVDHDGLKANFVFPGGKKKLPAIIVLGGSGGGIGWQDFMAKFLASKGYAVLSLAYFRMEGLPATLEEIPLEYFKTAIDWLKVQPLVDPNKIGVIGSSKGGELALLLGTM
ncbi:MAG: hypothetical protein GY765_03795 [bacterium]|nr:hypothetical protein [bacterium]